MNQYLAASEFIDFDHHLVARKAQELADGASDQRDLINRCFHFVRDAIKHSVDYRMNPVTCKASDVLRHGNRVLLRQESSAGGVAAISWCSHRAVLSTTLAAWQWGAVLSPWFECCAFAGNRLVSS